SEVRALQSLAWVQFMAKLPDHVRRQKGLRDGACLTSCNLARAGKGSRGEDFLISWRVGSVLGRRRTRCFRLIPTLEPRASLVSCNPRRKPAGVFAVSCRAWPGTIRMPIQRGAA